MSKTKLHYILYVDVLGYKKTLDRIKDEDVFLNEIEQMFKEEIIKNAKKKLAKYKIFSDNVIIAFPKVQDEKENENRIRKICRFAARLQEQCLRKYGILLRGSIVEGALFINDDFVYGSGLIKAYELENSKAIYPRIIIDEGLKEASYISASENTIFKEEIWDKYFFINFFNYYHPQINVDDDRKENLIKITEQIDNHIEEESSSDSRVLQKLYWLKQFMKYLQDNERCIKVNTKQE